MTCVSVTNVCEFLPLFHFSTLHYTLTLII